MGLITVSCAAPESFPCSGGRAPPCSKGAHSPTGQFARARHADYRSIIRVLRMGRLLLGALATGALCATGCGSDTAQSGSDNFAGAAGSERDGASSNGGGGGSGASTGGGFGGESGAAGSSGAGGVSGAGGALPGGSAGSNTGGSGGAMPPSHTGGVAGASTLSCGTTTCSVNQLCVIPCCGGSPGFTCTPAPPHCVDIPAGCNDNVQPSCVESLCFSPTVEKGTVFCHCA